MERNRGRSGELGGRIGQLRGRSGELMGRIFVTGDTHGGQAGDMEKLNSKSWPIGKSLTRDDYLIVTGDFGCLWYPKGSHKEKKDLHVQKFLSKHKPWTTLFIDGNHCFSKDTEVLTEKGWMNFKESFCENIKIAEFDVDTRKIFYSHPIERIECFSEKMVRIKSPRVDMKVTVNHDVIYKNEKIKAGALIGMENISENGFIESCFHDEDPINLSDNELRLITWVAMDATVIDFSLKNKNSRKMTIQFKLSKKRKIDRLRNLLNKMDIEYTFKPATMSGVNNKQPYYIRIYGDFARGVWRLMNGERCLPKSFAKAGSDQAGVILGELKETDGRDLGNRIIWSTTEICNRDIIQIMCISNGMRCYWSKRDNSKGFGNKTQWRVTIMKNSPRSFYKVKAELEHYRDKTYCYKMPRGTLVTRFNGRVSFIGNENHDELDKLEQVPMFGGHVGKVSENIFHLKRGQIYTIHGKTFFCMGGAESTDKESRTIGMNWWPQEVPSCQEFNEGLANLEARGNKVDYILSHNCPRSVSDEFIKQHNAEGLYNIKINCPVGEYLDQVCQEVEFKHLFFGHWHDDWTWDKYTMLYQKVIEVK